MLSPQHLIKQWLRLQIEWRQKRALFSVEFISLDRSTAYIKFRIIMSFHKTCHMPFRKLIPPFTLTDFRGLVWNRCGKVHFYVWNRVRIRRTGRHIPTKNSQEYPPGFRSSFFCLSVLFSPFSLLVIVTFYAFFVSSSPKLNVSHVTFPSVRSSTSSPGFFPRKKWEGRRSRPSQFF